MFEDLGTAVKHRNNIYDEVKSRLNSKNACYDILQKVYGLKYTNIISITSYGAKLCQRVCVENIVDW